MTDHQFTAGQRVWHPGCRQFGTYVRADLHADESIVAFPRDHVPGWPDEDEHCRITTAQLVPADEVPA